MPATFIGVRHHSHRPLAELGPMAAEILLAMLARAGLDVPSATELVRFEDSDHAPVPVPIERHERPPVVALGARSGLGSRRWR